MEFHIVTNGYMITGHWLLGVAQRPQPVVYDGANADILENLIGRTLR